MDVHKALADTVVRPYWLDNPAAPAAQPALTGGAAADLVVVGGGYGGLWTALLAKERDPARDVVLLEGNRIGWAATGRNGGFCSASLTHGLSNGIRHFGGEIGRLEELGAANLTAIGDTVRRYGIDCGFERTGELVVATEPWQLDELITEAEQAAELGADPLLLDAAEVRGEVNSPTYLGGVWDPSGCALVEPAELAWGLRTACLGLGVRIHEHTPVTGIRDAGGGRLRVATRAGAVTAPCVALATGAFPGPLRRRRTLAIPVYDYALMSEPLDDGQLAAIGWRNRQGMGDGGNLFHYYRLTSDNRILWGGYDAIYHYGGRIGAALDDRRATFETLARHFYLTFPQLEDVRFSHAWGGVIDTSSRFCPFFGRAHGGRLAYTGGYTGLGVGATRFGAQVMLDLLSGRSTELTQLRMVRSMPVPFPPEPIRSGVVQLTRWSTARADRNRGHRGLWLKTLDTFGVGFDS